MASSFKLDDGGDNDTVLTLVLAFVFLIMSFVNIWIRIPPVVIHPAPLIAFLITRWTYKRHFRKRNGNPAQLVAEPI